MALCVVCGGQIETPGKQGICYGCFIDTQYIPADYEQREQYIRVCPVCGWRWSREEQEAGGGQRIISCSQCGTIRGRDQPGRWNATRRPPLGVDWLDRRIAPLGIAALKTNQRPRF